MGAKVLIFIKKKGLKIFFRQFYHTKLETNYNFCCSFSTVVDLSSSSLMLILVIVSLFCEGYKVYGREQFQFQKL